jgi:hypothetical protein
MFILSSLSVERSFKRRFSSSTLGGFTKTANVSSGNFFLYAIRQQHQYQKITFFPIAQMRSTSLFNVP